jgi:hypothetical protein
MSPRLRIQPRRAAARQCKLNSRCCRVSRSPSKWPPCVVEAPVRGSRRVDLAIRTAGGPPSVVADASQSLPAGHPLPLAVHPPKPGSSPMLASDHRTASYACDANSRRAALLTRSRGLYLCPGLRRGEAGLDAELSRRATPRYSSLDASQLARRPLRPRLEGYPQCSGGEIGPMDCPVLALLTKGARLGRH